MRKKYSAAFLILVIVVAACKTKDKPAGKSDNYADAARNFIRAALDGKFLEAGTFMLRDSSNLEYLDVAERSYQRTEQSVKDGYRGSSIRIHQPIVNVNDSTSIIIFSNSFKNDPDTLKVLRVNGTWLVDLKYLYQHDSDTIINKPVTNDSLK
ncbi:MAG: hypothetical protein ABL876_03250 [Chitinophagaceae bacterium]